jgi:Photosystem I psaA/psaB protein.
MFWMLNTIGWVTFYWHWKQLGVWSGNTAQFNENSTYLMGWLRDYLWANSAQLIGYRARIRNHGHSCFLCEIVIRSQFHTTYEPEA